MIFIVGILLKLPLFFSNSPVIIRKQDGFLFDKIIKFLSPVANTTPFIYALIAYLILFWHAYLLTHFINNQRFVSKANYLPGLAFMLLTSFLPEFSYFSAPLIASLLFLMCFICLFKAHNPDNAKGLIFNSGLALGVATMFFQPSLFFILWGLLALSILRPFRFTEWLLMILGCSTPYYFYLIYLFLTNQWSIASTLFEIFSFGIKPEHQSIWFAGALFLTILPLLAGIYYVYAQYSKMLMHIKKGWLLFLLYLIMTVIIAFINPGPSLSNWVMILAPCAAFHGYGYFNSELKLYPTISFWITIGYIIAIHAIDIGK